MKNPFRKKSFITQVMLRAQKAYHAKGEATLASCIMLAFMPVRSDTPAIQPLREKPPIPHYGNKKLRMAQKGKFNGQGKHGLMGSVIARMKQDKFLNARGER